MRKDGKIFVAGHRWLVGSAIIRELKKAGYTNIITRWHAEVDLTNQQQAADFFASEKPNYVFLAAAKVGWIGANNTYPADFIQVNLDIQNNVIREAHRVWVEKLLFLWSSCIYPKECPQPMKEEYLLTGPLEPTNEPYAIAKIAGIKMCQSYNRQYGTNFIACMPTNLYGPGDNFDLEKSHVLPALLRKFHDAKVANSPEVVCRWDGTPLREFLYVDDMADACIYMMEKYTPTKEQNIQWDVFRNIWSGEEVSIKELAELIQKVVWYEWKIVRDTTKPNGTMRKFLDSRKLHDHGRKAKIWLEEWIKTLYDWYLQNLPTT